MTVYYKISLMCKIPDYGAIGECRMLKNLNYDCESPSENIFKKIRNCGADSLRKNFIQKSQKHFSGGLC